MIKAKCTAGTLKKVKPNLSKIQKFNCEHFPGNSDFCSGKIVRLANFKKLTDYSRQETSNLFMPWSFSEFANTVISEPKLVMLFRFCRKSLAQFKRKLIMHGFSLMISTQGSLVRPRVPQARVLQRHLSPLAVTWWWRFVVVGGGCWKGGVASGMRGVRQPLALIRVVVRVHQYSNDWRWTWMRWTWSSTTDGRRSPQRTSPHTVWNFLPVGIV